jgi:hypothetical protein
MKHFITNKGWNLEVADTSCSRADKRRVVCLDGETVMSMCCRADFRRFGFHTARATSVTQVSHKCHTSVTQVSQLPYRPRNKYYTIVTVVTHRWEQSAPTCRLPSSAAWPQSSLYTIPNPPSIRKVLIAPCVRILLQAKHTTYPIAAGDLPHPDCSSGANKIWGRLRLRMHGFAQWNE